MAACVPVTRACYQVLFSWGYRGRPRGAEGQAKVCCRGNGPCWEASVPLAFAVPHWGMETWHHLRSPQALLRAVELAPMHSWRPSSTCPGPAPAAVPAGRPGAPPRVYLGSKSRTILENPGFPQVAFRGAASEGHSCPHRPRRIFSLTGPQHRIPHPSPGAQNPQQAHTARGTTQGDPGQSGREASRS